MRRLYDKIIILLVLCLLAGCGTSISQDSQYNTETKNVTETESEIDEESENDTSADAETESEDGTGGNTESGSENKETESEINTENSSNSGSDLNSGNGPDAEEDTEADAKVEIPTTDPYVGMTKEEFYANYQPATCLADALYRSKHGFLSGSLEVPGQHAKEASYRPMEGSKYVRNTDSYYRDGGDTYVVVDSYGKEVMRIYKGGGYITLEEVAAYVYAFGGTKDGIPANYTTSKKTKPTSSIWGEYLRVNHSYFSGDTSKYPYEPTLPNISGCGGKLQYWELDIGTTGTTTPGYSPKPYNNGSKIERGAARIVYGRQDLNQNGIYEKDEIYVFYTHNHYNDFREYLNYYGGWGEVFGNVTGGGVFDSKTQCNPTPYVPTAYRSFSQRMVHFKNINETKLSDTWLVTGYRLIFYMG